MSQTSGWPSESPAECAGRRTAERLTPLLYEELRRLAGVYLRQERPNHTLQPTALLHEAYLRLASRPLRIRDRGHFLALASQAMRRILVDHALKRRTQKRGGGCQPVGLDQAADWFEQRSRDVLALDLALNALATIDPLQSRIVELRFFGGLTSAEAAELLGMAPRTLEREWQMARAWLRRELAGAAGPDGGGRP